MTPVRRPRWAAAPDIWLQRIRLADYEAIQARRDRMLKVVHKEVEDYLNTTGLYSEGNGDGFPNRSRMTGEYYTAEETYTADDDTDGFMISIKCHCLGHRVKSRKASDYLGLEVWLECDESYRTFTVFRNTDSSVI